MIRKIISLCAAVLLAASFSYGADAAAFRTPEYNFQWALDMVGAADAYALGFTGKNVTVAVLDSGMNPRCLN